jgi:methionine-gamma-lyase
VSIEQETSLEAQGREGQKHVPNQLTQRTRAVHAGENRDGNTRPLVTPIYQSTAFASDEAGISSERHECGEPSYSRDRFPNLRELEQAVADLERHDVLLCVDNTFATPIFCRPIEHGADLVVHSATKFLGGHHDLTAGVVVGFAPLIDRLQRTGYLVGTLPGAMDAWLALRGIRTLAPRMTWIAQTAGVVARALEGHPAIARVRYPGTASGTKAEIIQRMLPDGAGGMLAVQFADGDAATETFISALRLIPYVPSLGGVTTSVCYPPRSLEAREQERQANGWLRFSIGLEAPEDLIADITQALAAIKDESRGRG